MPNPYYAIITGDGEEIDITTDVELLQYQSIKSSPLIAKSIDREAERVKAYAKKVDAFVVVKREALHSIINYLVLETVSYKIAVPEAANNLKGKDMGAVIRDIKRGKWQVSERTLRPVESKTLSEYLIADIRANHINKNVLQHI